MYYENMAGAVVSNVLFFLAIMLCMATIIYVVLTRLITRPLEELRHSLADLSDGSPSGPSALPDKVAPVYASREIDELFAQFDAMASSLSSLYGNEEVNDKLKRQNQYKSDFLAIVSHELRTPLTSILAFTDLMADSVPRADELVRKQLEEIDKNGRILLEMVDNVLETARIQAGSERLNLELVDLSDVVGMVEASSLSLAAKKRIALATRVAGEGARLVVIEVADDGIGIPADKQELIFERFAQENMSTVRRYGGSGLGLSLVKDLAAMLGGAVSLESRVGEGSVFRVVLPADGGTEGEDE